MTTTISYKHEDLTWVRKYAFYHSQEEAWLPCSVRGIVHSLNSDEVLLVMGVKNVLYKIYGVYDDAIVHGYLHLVPINEPKLPFNFASSNHGVAVFSCMQREPDWFSAIQLPVRDNDFLHDFVDEFVLDLPESL